VVYPMVMGSVLLRCLVVLVALTFLGGTPISARTPSMASGLEGPVCHDTVDAGTSIESLDNHSQHGGAHECTCCCLGCANCVDRAPDGTSGLVPPALVVSYGERTNALAARILHPDPYPPKAST
jgi:hypothetical protein